MANPLQPLDAKLAARDPDTIRRLITNQKHEHVPHAFRAGHGGMQDFNRLIPVLRSLPSDKIGHWLNVIDEVYKSHQDCQSCGCKVLAYQALISQGLLPERHQSYLEQYQRRIRHSRSAGRRDFMAEVIDSFIHGRDHVNGLKYRTWWDSLYETSIRPDDPESAGLRTLDKR